MHIMINLVETDEAYEFIINTLIDKMFKGGVNNEDN